ncbi:unnamed protein product [Adineta ricciae]|uniref:Uncharacterized protein n=1 Tax=Adineta ricciae TaxID=249248 RepID=A0A815VVA9_ADIRI|nr:unnamed protein product [Adineta ricciae]
MVVLLFTDARAAKIMILRRICQHQRHWYRVFRCANNSCRGPCGHRLIDEITWAKRKVRELIDENGIDNVLLELFEKICGIIYGYVAPGRRRLFLRQQHQ